MPGAATWHGTADEWGALWLAIGRYCTCEFEDRPCVEPALCAAHALLLDQAVLDHLLYGRRLRERFVRAERAATRP
jgi:hypothetical protein